MRNRVFSLWIVAALVVVLLLLSTCRPVAPTDATGPTATSVVVSAPTETLAPTSPGERRQSNGTDVTATFAAPCLSALILAAHALTHPATACGMDASRGKTPQKRRIGS